MELAAKCMEARMRNLAEQKNVDVLEYVYDKQDRETDSVNVVKLATVVAEERRLLGKSIGNKEARDVICGKDRNLADFQRNYPAIFNACLDIQGAPRHLDMLKVLSRIRQNVESGTFGEAEANVHATRVMLERTLRAPKPGETSGSV